MSIERGGGGMIHSHIYLLLLLLFQGEGKKARNISKMSTLLRKSEHLNPFKCQLEPSVGLGVRKGEGINARFHIIYQSFFLFLIY